MQEIIHVVDGDPFSATPADGPRIEAMERSLAAGYYLVLRPTRKGAKKRRVRYFGPLRTAGEARLLWTSAWVLGLSEQAQAHAPIAECCSTPRGATAANDGFQGHADRRQGVRASR